MRTGKIFLLLVIVLSAMLFLGCTRTSEFIGSNVSINETGSACPPGCSAHGSCTYGVCVCAPGWKGVDCSIASITPPINVTNTTSAPIPEGCISDKDCAMNQFCNTTSGTCTCNSAWMDCDLSKTNGCEVNVLTSSSNCGTCGLVCSGDRVCIVGVCASTKKPDGTSCTKDDECENNNCYPALSGKRCAPNGKTCSFCQVIDDTGTSCIPAASGSDPKDDCVKTAEETCGTTGQCDGSSSCRMWSASTECSVGSCSNNWYAAPGKCSGDGVCIAGSRTACDDGDLCTDDDCDPISGCTHKPIGCDDGNECTTDSCSPNGCAHAQMPIGTNCSIGVCQGTTCVPVSNQENTN